jgi:3,4-dihydroxy 2-butanone 4-phosphate synthase/GTP cyclohydrolase II
VPDLVEFCEHDFLLISIAELIRYRRQNEKLAAGLRGPHPHRVGRLQLPSTSPCSTASSTWAVRAVQGETNAVRRSECLTGDVFGSLRCDCGIQLDQAMKKVADEQLGVVVYLRGHEGRGIGLGHKIRAYNLQEQGMDTIEANEALGLPIDSREYGIGAQILVDLGITTMRYMTNNPAKYGGIEGFGLEITERVPLQAVPNPENIEYLRTKRERMVTSSKDWTMSSNFRAKDNLQGVVSAKAVAGIVRTLQRPDCSAHSTERPTRRARRGRGRRHVVWCPVPSRSFTAVMAQSGATTPSSRSVR